jgi:hypothetical protein
MLPIWLERIRQPYALVLPGLVQRSEDEFGECDYPGFQRRGVY